MMKKPIWVIGIDEVGRGPLAGPVYVCAVAMLLAAYKKRRWSGLRDSKKMTRIAREAWYRESRKMNKSGVLRIAIASRCAAAIDTHGITVCIHQCIQRAVQKLGVDPNHCTVLLDGGLKAPALYIHQQAIIRGDDKHQIISLASVVAKVTRDKRMVRFHQHYPLYGFDQHKGYGTRAHRSVLHTRGMSSIHRKSFISKIVRQAPNIDK